MEVAAVAPFVEEAGERGGESGVLRVGPEGPPGLGRGALVGLRRRGGLRGLQVGGSAEDAACGKVDVSSIRWAKRKLTKLKACKMHAFTFHCCQDARRG